VKRARFAVVAKRAATPFLIEPVIMSHPQESKRIFDPQYQAATARAIPDGILALQNIVDG